MNVYLEWAKLHKEHMRLLNNLKRAVAEFVRVHKETQPD